MANSSINLTSLDFDSIKSSLKTYLKSQSVFKDYDYDGSNMSVLLDVLSYNTYLNSFYLNMMASEAFLDTAQLRESVVSHAKSLNYTPYSMHSSEATVNISFQTSGINTGILEMPKGTSRSESSQNVLDRNLEVCDDPIATDEGNPAKELPTNLITSSRSDRPDVDAMELEGDETKGPPLVKSKKQMIRAGGVWSGRISRKDPPPLLKVMNASRSPSASPGGIWTMNGLSPTIGSKVESEVRLEPASEPRGPPWSNNHRPSREV